MPKFNIRSFDYPPSGFEEIDVSNAAAGKGLTAAKIGKAAFITVEDADIRYRIDGTAPTATVGHLVTKGSNIWLAEATCLSDLKMIRNAGVDAKVFVTHY